MLGSKAFKEWCNRETEAMLYKIGEFAGLARVTVRALRYYEEVGLLDPANTDKWTGYRYYTADQLPRLNRILALKDLGFNLDQIRSMMNEEVSAAELRGMLKLKRADLEHVMGDLQAQLLRVEARLVQIERENEMPEYDVVVKPLEPQRVAIARGVVPNMDVIGPTFDRLFDDAGGYVERNRLPCTGPAMALYFSSDESMENMQVGAALPTSAPVTAGEHVGVEDLPGSASAACVVHRGPFATLSKAYNAVYSWIQDNGYTVSGPSREVYLEYERGGDQSKYVTEIQVPVSRR